MPKRYSGTTVVRPEGRTEKILRVLDVLREQGKAPGHHAAAVEPLSRQRLAERADVTMRNLDAIIASLRQQGYGIAYDDNTGYYLQDEGQHHLPCVRTPEHFESLRSLRRYLERAGTTVDHDRWLDLIDQLIHCSEETRRRNMGRSFSDAQVDEQGVVYRMNEPMIFYLNVHRAAPDPVTKANIARLKQAISSNVAVRMKYVNRAGERDTIVVEPYFIFEREGTYYLAGLQVADGKGTMKRSRFKPFTLTKVRCASLDLMPDHVFQPKRCYAAEQCLTVTGIGSGKANDRVTAEIDVFGRFAYNVCETLHGEESTCTWISTAPGHQQLRIKATFGSRYDLMRFVLAFGEHACLISPPDVRAMIVDNIKGMTARYAVPVALEQDASFPCSAPSNVVAGVGEKPEITPGSRPAVAESFEDASYDVLDAVDSAGIVFAHSPVGPSSSTRAAEMDTVGPSSTSGPVDASTPRRRGRPHTRPRPQD